MAAIVMSDAWPSNKVVPTDTNRLPIKPDLSHTDSVVISLIKEEYINRIIKKHSK